MRPDTPVQWHASIDSTNEEARRLAQAGHYGPIWIAAREQTAGRGRLGRQWSSPTGNLYCTALFLEPGGIQVATRFPFAAGLAIADICAQIAPDAPVKLKWPNDVRVDGAKLCGILVEAGAGPGGASWVAAGMGTNVQSAPEAVGQSATCLKDMVPGAPLDADLVMEAIRPAFAKRIAQARDDFPGLLNDWLTFAEGLGETVRIGKDVSAKVGRFVGLESDGGLRLELPNGAVEIIRAGDVELVREVG
ncbi:biotin--[acetyl-CoA-carboxylase] ligase [Henriciella sp. AS95]|uniref:biotin--[acetyl-CoA-carboxylase] ligase n=1 Tax=Henriciella sp. AS95 TaxID=3135782 RepID=UPI003177CF7A